MGDVGSKTTLLSRVVEGAESLILNPEWEAGRCSGTSVSKIRPDTPGRLANVDRGTRNIVGRGSKRSISPWLTADASLTMRIVEYRISSNAEHPKGTRMHVKNEGARRYKSTRVRSHCMRPDWSSTREKPPDPPGNSAAPPSEAGPAWAIPSPSYHAYCASRSRKSAKAWSSLRT